MQVKIVAVENRLMLAKFDFWCDGLVAQHNFPCPVCTKAPAVYHTNIGVFQPCWGCQETGWKIRFEQKWWEKLFGTKSVR
jgi:hypothetical protein